MFTQTLKARQRSLNICRVWWYNSNFSFRWVSIYHIWWGNSSPIPTKMLNFSAARAAVSRWKTRTSNWNEGVVVHFEPFPFKTAFTEFQWVAGSYICDHRRSFGTDIAFVWGVLKFWGQKADGGLFLDSDRDPQVVLFGRMWRCGWDFSIDLKSWEPSEF